MKASDDLYQLIASLTRAEKRYCRLHISRGSGRDAVSCLKLFDAIAALPAYDEAQVRNALTGERFLAHLPVTKHYLYSILLRALRAFNSRKFAEARVHEFIDNVHLLLEKGLMDQCAKQLALAMKCARKYELFESQLEIKRLEWSVQYFHAYSRRMPEHVDRLIGEVEEIMPLIRNYWEYHRLGDRMSRMMLVHGKPRNADERKKYDEMMETPLLASEDMAYSLSTKQLYYDIRRVYYLMTCDYEGGYQHSLHHIAIFEELVTRDMPNSIDHGAILYTHVCICIRLDRLDEAELAYRKILEIQRPTPLADAMLKRLAFQAIISLRYARKEFAEIAALESELDEFFRGTRDVGMRQARVAIPFMVACGCFLVGRYSDASRLLHALINEPDPDVRPDLQALARLLRLMIHYELGNMELLPYLWRSTYRGLCRQNNLHSLERCVLDFMRRLPGIRTGRELRRAFMEFKEKIEVLNDDPMHTETIIALNVLPWLQRKVEEEGSGRLVHIPAQAGHQLVVSA